jgi:hypothetical protein
MNLSADSAKPTLADRRKFYFIALGSFRECQTALRLHGRVPLNLAPKADFLGACLYRLCKAMNWVFWQLLLKDEFAINWPTIIIAGPISP